MPFFKRGKKSEERDWLETDSLLEPDEVREAEDVSEQRVEEAVAVPTEEEEGSGEPPESEPAEEKRDFFELDPEEVSAWKPSVPPLAARRPRLNPWPVVFALLGIVITGGLVTGIALLWPSSDTRVPDLIGKSLSEALDSTRSACLSPRVTGWSYSEEHSDGVILFQQPPASTLVKKGTEISLTASKGPSPELDTPIVLGTMPTPPASKGPTGPLSDMTICLDPGHQVLPSQDEWVDPGLNRKTNVGPGARGVDTGNAEYLVDLDIALKLKDLLEKDGVNVVITRSKNEVDLSQATRAEMADNAKADLLVSIHCGNTSEPLDRGTATFYPGKNKYTESFYEESKTAALYVQEAVTKACRTEDRGIFSTEDIGLFNWSKVPVIETDIAYLSNPENDRRLSEDEFRWKAAWGLRNGIIKYLTTP